MVVELVGPLGIILPDTVEPHQLDVKVSRRELLASSIYNHHSSLGPPTVQSHDSSLGHRTDPTITFRQKNPKGFRRSELWVGRKMTERQSRGSLGCQIDRGGKQCVNPKPCEDGGTIPFCPPTYRG